MVTSVVQVEFGAFLLGLAAIVGFQLLTGRINMSGLLCQKTPPVGTAEVSAGRVQLMYATLIGAGYYLLQVFQDPTRLHDVPEWLLLVQGGSGGIYLVGKGAALYKALPGS